MFRAPGNPHAHAARLRKRLPGNSVMPDALPRKETWRRIGLARLAAIDRLLMVGIEVGPACKQRAINKVLREVPGVTRGDCWQRIRHVRKIAKRENRPLDAPVGGALEATTPHGARSWRPWTQEDDDRLLTWVGYEPVEKIAQRLSRSGRAVRFRLCALGMSARVTDGWSLRALRKLLRVSPAKLRQFIGSGMLRVRDPRITARSLAALGQRNGSSLDCAAVERVATLTATRKGAYTWERAAEILGADLKQVQSWIAAGQLKVKDTFVTDRSFEEFCKKYGSGTNLTLIDQATRKWLVEEYGVEPAQTDGEKVSRAQKHALVVRTCKCGRTIAGNAYFRHLKACKIATSQPPRTPLQKFRALGRTLGGST